METVEVLLRRLDTALNPAGIAGFLGGEVDPYLRKRMKDRFLNEGDDVVGGWAPLSLATQDIRSDAGYGAAHPINVRTGEMEDYITNSPHNLQVEPWGASLTLPGKPPTGEMKDKVERAQFGDNAAPPRPVLGMNERDLAFVLLGLGGWIKKSVGRVI